MSKLTNVAAAVLCLICSFGARAIPITIDFQMGPQVLNYGSFTFDSSLDGSVLSYGDLDSFSITLFSGAEYDLAFVNSGGFGQFLYFAFDTTVDDFIITDIDGFDTVFAAIKAPAEDGFWVGDCDQICTVADYPAIDGVFFDEITITRSVAAVPLPGSLVLLGLGLASIGFIGRQQA